MPPLLRIYHIAISKSNMDKAVIIGVITAVIVTVILRRRHRNDE